MYHFSTQPMSHILVTWPSLTSKKAEKCGSSTWNIFGMFNGLQRDCIVACVAGIKQIIA